MTEIVKGKIVNPYECANIGNDDYTIDDILQSYEM